MSLRCALEATTPVAVVRLAGRLDQASAVDARACLHKALTEQPAAIVVDLSELAPAGDAEVTVFGTFAGTAATASGCPVALCVPPGRLRAALDRLRIVRTAPVYPTREEALAAIRAGLSVRRYRQRLSATSAAPAVARGVVTDACRAWGLPELVDPAEVVVTELVTNAARHAGGDVQLVVTLSEQYVHISVRDGSPVLPVRVDPTTYPGTGGRGLVVVEALAANWGSAAAEDGKVVWATLRLPRV